MKFLCVPCDEPMKLSETAPPDKGSIALRYACDACGYEFAMLTNAFETQLVSSLGVKMGPSGEPAPTQTVTASNGEKIESTSKCPFSGMLQAGGAMATETDSSGSATTQTAPHSEPAGFPWSPEARERMSTVPDFIRPMAMTGIEKFAQDKGYTEVNEEVLTEAREYFGMSN